MVVIAGLIGGGGLGAVVNSGLYSNPALALLAGVVIVIMAMALDRDHGGRSPIAPTRRSATSTTPPNDGCACSRLPLPRSSRRRWSSRRSSESAATTPTTPVSGSAASRRRSGCSRRSRKCSTTSRTRRRSSSRSRSRSGTSSSPKLLLPLQGFLVEAPWFTTLGGLTLIAFVISGFRPAVTTFLMLALIGFTGCLGARHGHAVPGAGGDAHRGGWSASGWASGRPRAARCRRRCDRSTTCCRLCRSSSTSSRSSI